MPHYGAVFPTAHSPPAPSRLSQPDFARRPLSEQQIALSLLQFADNEHGLDLSRDRMENLLGALIVSFPLTPFDLQASVLIKYAQAEAPAGVIAQSAESEANETLEQPEQTDEELERERQDLEKLQALISKKLAAMTKRK